MPQAGDPSSAHLTQPTSGGAAFRPPSPGKSALDPGVVFSARYRIVSLLGVGGMGEVYRADDLTLAAPVALKFLPAEFASDPARLDRFLSEVRITRQVSHAHVCRVYDIAQSDGRWFLSMEYIDGETLASLLRRIGRLPHDKAVAIARQLCFGLAAAHEQGVIHRDLKPANILIDGRGNARIVDFGVAGIAADLAASGDIAAGTPAYMAPEQIAGRDISKRSDIYSLGLVLYELFTGRAAYNASTIADIRRAHDTGTRPSAPSSHVPDLDPAVERIILRCLEPDPADRPPSVMAIAAALPGGDPLAAALAAGETPSPELVAASGATTGLAPRTALALLAAFLLALIVVQASRARSSIIRYAPPELSPDVLTAKARDLIAQFGYTDRPADSASRFSTRDAYLQHIHRTNTSPDRWAALSTAWAGPLAFWYRQGPSPLIPTIWHLRAVLQDYPPNNEPGSIRTVLDQRGKLISFSATPPETLSDDPTVIPAGLAPPDWAGAFKAAGLDFALFAPAHPTFTPDVPSDTRLVWTGPVPHSAGQPHTANSTPAETSDETMSVNAATNNNRVVYFRIVPPWAKPGVFQSGQSKLQQAGTIVESILEKSLIIGAAIVAWRNLRAGRVDKRGALRIGLAMLALEYLNALFASTNIITFLSADPLGHPLARALYHGWLWCVVYMALEPTIRRFWPHLLISWSRLISGRVRDPLVGRDALIGCLFGAATLLVIPLRALLTNLLDHDPVPGVGGIDALVGGRYALGLIIDALTGSLVLALGATWLLAGLRVLIRRNWINAVLLALAILMVSVGGSGGGGGLPGLLATAAIAALYTFVLMRYGVFSLLMCVFIARALDTIPATLDLSAWFAVPTLTGLAVAVAIAAYACRVATAPGARTTAE